MVDLEDERFARNFVDGSWDFSREGYEIDVQDPRDGQKIAEISRSSRRDVAHVAEVAKHAGISWSRTTVEERRAAVESALATLRAMEPDLIEVLALDAGVPIGAGRKAVSQLIDATILLLASEASDGPRAQSHEQLGTSNTSAHLHDWNSPPVAFAGVFGDILRGHSVVLHPSDLTPLFGAMVARTFAEFPAGVANLIQGTRADVALPLVSTDLVDRVVFHGSRDGAAQAMRAAADHLKDLDLTVSGPRIVLVLDGAAVEPLALSVREELVARTVCPFATTIVVHALSSVYDEVRSAVLDQVVALGNHHWANPNEMQPLPSEASERLVASHLETIAASSDATLLSSGEWRPPKRGYWCPPMVLENYPSDPSDWPSEFVAPVIVLQEIASPMSLPSIPRRHLGGPATTVWNTDGTINISR